MLKVFFITSCHENEWVGLKNCFIFLLVKTFTKNQNSKSVFSKYVDLADHQKREEKNEERNN